MSAYSENKTQFTDPDLLCEALAEMGFDASMIERHQVAQPMKDWHGRTTTYVDVSGDKAEIIIRRNFVNQKLSSGMSNDIGFKRGSDGKYSAIISKYDSNFANEKWVNTLKQTYAVKGIQKQASKVGLRFTGQAKVNGKIQLQFVKA